MILVISIRNIYTDLNQQPFIQKIKDFNGLSGKEATYKVTEAGNFLHSFARFFRQASLARQTRRAEESLKLLYQNLN